MGDIMSTMGDYLEYCGVFSTVGDIMMHVGDIMSIVEGVQYRGGYHPLKFEYRRGYHDTCGGYHEYRAGVQYRGVLKYQKIFPHGTEHPPRYSWYPPHAS